MNRLIANKMQEMENEGIETEDLAVDFNNLLAVKLYYNH